MEGKRVVLIQKKKPEWQLNRFNGVGGKVEDGETAPDAMEREFNEEAGIGFLPWTSFATLKGEGWEVECFYHHTDNLLMAKTQYDDTDNIPEPVFKCDADCPPLGTIPNVRWLIQMALSMTRGETCRHFTIEEK